MHAHRSLVRTAAATASVLLFAAACGSNDSDAEAAADSKESETETESGNSEAEDSKDSGDSGEATDYPTRNITWIVPYSPGGGSDAQLRRLQSHVEDELGVTINAVYQTGGDGAVGWQQLAAAEPDGYTIGNTVWPNIGVLGLQTDSLGFDITELSFIAWTESSTDALVVAQDSEYETAEDFIEAAKANPGEVTIAGTGRQAAEDIEAITEKLGIEITPVPVSGGFGSMLPQIQGGHVDGSLTSIDGVMRNQDTLKALATAGPERAAALPDVPTFQELGYDVNVETARGLAAPPGTPDEILAVLNEAVNNAVSQVEEELKEGGLTPLHQTPEEAQEYTREALEQLAEGE